MNTNQITTFAKVKPWQIVERSGMPGHALIKIPNLGEVNACAVIKDGPRWKDPCGQLGTSALCIRLDKEVVVVDKHPNVLIFKP